VRGDDGQFGKVAGNIPGTDTAAILAELGLGTDEVARLVADGVVSGLR
jgi:hypothetical protein